MTDGLGELAAKLELSDAPPAAAPAQAWDVQPGQSEVASAPARVVRRRISARVIGVLVVSILAMFAVTFAVYEYWLTGLLESRSQAALLSQFRGSLVLPDTPALITPPSGKPVGVMRIPTINVEQVVVEGIGSSDTKLGPGHDPSTPLPGEAGNSVVVGRRSTYGGPFGELDRLAPGALVGVVTREGQFTYQVVSNTTMPWSARPAAPTTNSQLTLISADSSFRPSSERVVVAKLEGEGLQSRSRLALPAPGEIPGKSTGGISWGPILLWGELFLVAIIASVYLYWRRWSAAVTYLLTTPVLITLAFLFYGAIDTVLPPSV